MQGNAASHEQNSGNQWQIKEAPMLCVVPLCITAVGCFVLFLFADSLFYFLQPIVSGD